MRSAANIDGTVLTNRHNRQKPSTGRYLRANAGKTTTNVATGVIVWNQPSTSWQFIETSAPLRMNAQVRPMILRLIEVVQLPQAAPGLLKSMLSPAN